MKISEEDEAKLEKLITDFLSLMEVKKTSKHYKSNSKYGPGSGFIELKSGLLVPEDKESVLVLDKEYDQYLFDLLQRFINLLWTNLDNPLFGFAERPLYEFITLWIFINSHPVISDQKRRRLKCLLFAGQIKYITESKKDLQNFIQARKSVLTAKDIEILNSKKLNYQEYFNRVWGIAKGYKYSVDANNYEAILNTHSDYDRIISHQHMRVHANPLQLAENLINKDAKTRRKLLVSMYIGQVCDYFRTYDKDLDKIFKQFEELQKNIKISV